MDKREMILKNNKRWAIFTAAFFKLEIQQLSNLLLPTFKANLKR